MFLCCHAVFLYSVCNFFNCYIFRKSLVLSPCCCFSWQDCVALFSLLECLSFSFLFFLFLYFHFIYFFYLLFSLFPFSFFPFSSLLPFFLSLFFYHFFLLLLSHNLFSYQFLRSLFSHHIFRVTFSCHNLLSLFLLLLSFNCHFFSVLILPNFFMYPLSLLNFLCLPKRFTCTVLLDKFSPLYISLHHVYSMYSPSVSVHLSLAFFTSPPTLHFSAFSTFTPPSVTPVLYSPAVLYLLHNISYVASFLSLNSISYVANSLSVQIAFPSQSRTVTKPKKSPFITFSSLAFSSWHSVLVN